MSKKPFEHIESRVREAAENSEPAFDELAWNKMEALLDKEGNKKRPFLWLWFALPIVFIAAIGTYYFAHKSSEIITTKTNDQSVIQDKTSLPQTNSISSLGLQKNTVAVDNNSLSIDNNSTQNKNNIRQQINNRQNLDYNHNIITAVGTTNGYGKTKKIIRSTSGSINTAQKNGEASELSNDNTVSEKEQSSVATINADNTVSENTLPQINGIKASAKDSVVIKDSVDEKNTTTTKKNTLAKTLAKQAFSRFYFLASIGIDASNVKFLSFQNSTISPKYGVGIGYQLSKKISIQTGFYAGRKQYIAGSNDYHAKYGTYLDSVDITKVNANCLVFEIPLSVRYNFLQKPSVVYYVTAGISSFIMKNEDYSYNYIANNNSYTTAHTYTGNKNLFSILTLSAGIEKKLTSKFSLQAEPSVNIPLAGVGEGSVKLYSTGIQVGVKYIP